MTTPTAPTEITPPAPVRDVKGTDYTILESADDQGSSFKYLGKIVAASGEAAIRKYAEQNQLAGIFAAIPDRNFTMAKVTSVVTTSFKVEEV